MRTFYAEVFIDDRLISTGTVSASGPATGMARVLRETLKTKPLHMRPQKWVVRLTKINPKKGDQTT